ncbi:hypothetical protein SAMN06264348_11167 [Oceanospirillum linum]|nr:hypothetical protein SAMN04489856_11168 [Oleiphilus messinensis]SMP34420.1 hypothetical protein SAMN06264348_11167 [Oceanospirillum linum]
MKKRKVRSTIVTSHHVATIAVKMGAQTYDRALKNMCSSFRAENIKFDIQEASVLESILQKESR